MVKRVFDVLVASILLAILFPVMVLVGLLLRAKLGPPVLFRQARPGFHAKPFEMLKFRTMLNAIDVDGHLRPDDARLTSFGRLLRSASLDELPELWNVFRGDMSLVGPRPLLMEYLPLYSDEQSRRHEVHPGITGWAQVNGRNDISWEVKFKLDTWYIDNQSFWLDIKILLVTIKKVILSEGISPEGHVIMPKFIGDKNKR
jgi:lipopolysaccharide/colanic/teichoic acid biosynthesis glycosyltransferase